MALEKMTSIHLANQAGIADWGFLSRSEMIDQYRKYAAQLKSEADAVLVASDDDFIVEQYCGVYARRNLRVIPPQTEGKQG